MTPVPVCALGLAALAAVQGSTELRRPFSLHGIWEGRVEPNPALFHEGLPQGGVDTGWTRLPIPSVFEETRAFADSPGGVVFLRCPFTFDRAPDPARRYRLRAGRVVESCRVWLNGAEVGEHHGGDVPIEWDLTGLIVKGKNLLVLAVSRELQGLPPGLPPLGALLDGITIEETSAWTLDDLTCACVPGEAAGVVEVGLEVSSTANDPAPLTVHLEVFSPAGGAAVATADLSFELAPRSRSTPSAHLAVPNAAPWEPANPTLYTAKATLLHAGVPVDARLVKFGFRSVEIRGEAFVLNGKPVKLKCATDAGYETGTWLRPTGMFDSRRKVKALKDAGFNAIRVPGRLPPRALVDAANELGLLVLAEPAVRGAEVVWVPLPAPRGFVPFPLPNLREPGARAARILEEQVRRDRNDPCVVWWGIVDGALALRRLVKSLDRDAIVSRNRMLSGSNLFSNPGIDTWQPYLRVRRSVAIPSGFAEAAGLLDLGDRGEFLFVELDAPPALTDTDRLVAGLGGDAWRLEARAFAGRGERRRAAFARGRLGEFFDSPEALVHEWQVLRGEFQRRAIELTRVNVHVGGYSVDFVADAPWAAGAGLFDWFGRPTPSLVLAEIAQRKRRYLAIPERRAGDAKPVHGLVDGVRFRFGALVDGGDPIRLLQVETRRPDELSGYSNTVADERFPYLTQADVGFGGGEGVYVVHPLWIGLEDPTAEQVGVLGIAAPHQPLTTGGPPIVRPRPGWTFAGDTGDLWENEDRFLEIADALDRARDGGVVALFFALTPGSPLVELGCLPPLTLRPARECLHAVAGDPVFAATAIRGPLGDPLNELVPLYTMAGLEASARWTVSIDRDGELAGVDFGRVAVGKGSVILTTLPIAENLTVSPAARRIVSNVVALLEGEAAASAPPLNAAADAARRERLDRLRARFRERRAARGN